MYISKMKAFKEKKKLLIIFSYFNLENAMQTITNLDIYIEYRVLKHISFFLF